MKSQKAAVSRRIVPILGLLVLPLALVAWALLAARPASADPFADPAFENLWQRTDQLVANGAVVRTWIWGPLPGPVHREPYKEGEGGTRLVQYFDKGRMEINHPAADANDPFYVTSGLLTEELISGQAQIGDANFETRSPAQIPIAGDRDDSNAPTYAAFASVADVRGKAKPAADATGQPVDQAIDRSGKTGPLAAGKSNYDVVYGHFEPETNHNIAGVFWDFLNSEGDVLAGGETTSEPLFQPWFKETGYPIAEAYWATVKIDGAASDVLIQPFQRRVLTYVPNADPAWRVEMGNIGLHYLEWRYGNGATPQPTGAPRPTAAPVTGLAPLVVQGIEIGKLNLDLNSQSVTIINNGSDPVNMTGYRLDSPKPNYIDTYRFPAGFTLEGGATVVVSAGQGADGPDKLYMHRVTWLFDSNGYDAIILYDNLGRETSRYQLQGGVAPTAEPSSTPTAEDTPTEGPTPLEPPTDTPTVEGETPTETGTPATETPTETATGTPATETPTVTGTPATVTPTVTRTKVPSP